MEFVKTAEQIKADLAEEEKRADENADADKKTKDPDMVIPGHIHNAKETAEKQGYLSYEDYIAKGGNPEDYQTPEQFIALKGPLKRIKDQTKQIKRMERDFNERLDSLNLFHKQQLEAQKAQLMAQRDAALDDYDKDKARAYQAQIDNINTQYANGTQPTNPQTQNLSQVLMDWNNDPANDWFKTDKAKAAYASIQFEEYRNQGYDDATAIRLMEGDVGKRFRDTNPNISGAPSMERGSKPGTKPPPKKLTMDDLTHDELSIWNHSGTMWPSKEAFLKSVSDSRSGNDG